MPSPVLKRVVCMACAAALGGSVHAQVRPDAGTLSEPSNRPLPLPAPPASPPPKLPETRPAGVAPSALRITPAAFRIEGNTLFSGAELESLLAAKVNQQTDLAGLTQAASEVAIYYRQHGYLLTEAYLPEQAFQAAGGTVAITVIEARIGKVSVAISDADTARISRAFAENLVRAQLRPGDPVTAYGLDKPVLLLRDLAGYDASATVEPGAMLGEADVTVAIRAQGPAVDGTVSLDNHGTRAAGQTRLTAMANVNNLLGRGDQLSLGGQQNDIAGTSLYRVAYTAPLGGSATRVGVSATRLEYALGKQFAALGATGSADVLALSLSYSLTRSRDSNLQLLLGAEQKKLRDMTAAPALESSKKINAFRIGIAGQRSDSLLGSEAYNTYVLTLSSGRLQLDPADLALDQGIGGLQTQGSFNTLNLDFQRTQFVSSAGSVYFGLQVQAASKNLSSAEKMSLGGATGVRAYPAGEAVGDAGYLMNIEYRHRLPGFPLVGPLTLLAFMDAGHVRFNQNGSSAPGAGNSATLGAAGFGLNAGRVGSYLIKSSLAWRLTDGLPTTGDPDRSPRVWLSAQKWF